MVIFQHECRPLYYNLLEQKIRLLAIRVTYDFVATKFALSVKNNIEKCLFFHMMHFFSVQNLPVLQKKKYIYI